jgi:hypothetical protein
MPKVTEVIPHMHISYVPVLEKMLAREGMDAGSTVEGVLKHFTPDRVRTNEENVALVALGGAESKHSITKFGPQLSFAQRCEILGLHRIGYTADVLAEAYDIDRRTITHIYNPSSSKYRNVRAQEKLDGPNFIEKYVTPEVRAKVEAFRALPGEANNKAASGMAGIHSVKGRNCEFNHRVAIGWMEPDVTNGIEVAGWYYKDMDGDFPETWLRCADESSLKNSRACYMAMLNEISDPI